MNRRNFIKTISAFLTLPVLQALPAFSSQKKIDSQTKVLNDIHFLLIYSRKEYLDRALKSAIFYGRLEKDFICGRSKNGNHLLMVKSDKPLPYQLVTMADAVLNMKNQKVLKSRYTSYTKEDFYEILKIL